MPNEANRIGGVVLDAKAMFLKSRGFTNIDLVGDDNLNLAKLLAGRIDLWVTGLYKGKEATTRLDNKAIKPVFIVREVEYFLACNPETPDAVIDRLTRALDAMRKEGRVKNIVDRYAERIR